MPGRLTIDKTNIELSTKQIWTFQKTLCEQA